MLLQMGKFSMPSTRPFTANQTLLSLSPAIVKLYEWRKLIPKEITICDYECGLAANKRYSTSLAYFQIAGFNHQESYILSPTHETATCHI